MKTRKDLAAPGLVGACLVALLLQHRVVSAGDVRLRACGNASLVTLFRPMPNSSVIAHALLTETESKLEPAFRWAEPPNPKSYSYPHEKRHLWTRGPDNNTVPKHRPPPRATATSPAPRLPPRACVQTSASSIEWATGAHYEGDIVDGLMHGAGRMTYPSGDVYEGEFQSGKRSGRGAYHHRLGVVTVSQWHNDRSVGVALIWSADRRQAWALLEGEIEWENRRVAPVDSATVLTGLRWHEERHGEVMLREAFALARQAGLEEIALHCGAPRQDMQRVGAFEPATREIWAKPPRPLSAAPVLYAHCPASQRPSPAMRQAAYMHSGNRPTYRPAPPKDAWPWPLARPVLGTPSETRRFEIERSIFERRESGAAALAGKAAGGSLVGVDRRALYASIYARMQQEGTAVAEHQAPTIQDLPAPTKPADVYATPWLTPGATPIEPTPTV